MGLLYSHYEANPITNNNLKINAVSGTLCKTFRKSYFARFEQGSPMEHFYFRDENLPCKIIDKTDNILNLTKDGIWERYKSTYYKLKEVVVLQIMLCAENNYIVEAIDKEEYDKIFDVVEKNK